ncbi:hypothetical protein R5R35_001843 [Gryllus longicercus]|uniref:Ankyrin repeat domain-containing protein n=1 Tax=Gryllus longicercus TaxID=2509291 RepID=A0AAN9YXS3_9ORTH
MENLGWRERIRSWFVPRPPRAPSGRALLEAARKGDWRRVNGLLAVGTRPDAARTLREQTALWLAAQHGFKKVAESLLAAGADPGAHDDRGVTCLLQAAVGGHYAIIDLMAVARPEVFQTESAALALRRAVLLHYPETVRSLLRGGTPVDARPNGHSSTLFVAAMCDSACLAELLYAGADLDEVDEFGRTALHHAAAADEHSCIGLLLTAGADVSIRDQDGYIASDLAVTTFVRRWLLPLVPVNGEAVIPDAGD